MNVPVVSVSVKACQLLGVNVPADVPPPNVSNAYTTPPLLTNSPYLYAVLACQADTSPMSTVTWALPIVL